MTSAQLAKISFNHEGSAASNRTLVNFLWINETWAEGKSETLCRLPLQYVELAVKNANLYAETDFQIWVDKKLIDDSTVFWLGAFIALEARHKNIKICNLQNIPAYAEDDVFVPPKNWTGDKYRDFPKSVYVRADYARILVLEHCLKTYRGYDCFVYSDMDCHDVQVRETVEIINKYGIAIHQAGNLLSHGYIGIAAHHERVLKAFPGLKKQSHEAAHNAKLGDPAFDSFLNEIGFPSNSAQRQIISRRLLPSVLETRDVIPLMCDLRIN